MGHHALAEFSAAEVALCDPLYAPTRQLFTGMLADADEIAADIAECLHARIPELADPSGSRHMVELTRQSACSNVVQMLALMADGAEPSSLVVPEAAAAWALELVHRHIPLAVLLRAYRIGHAYFAHTTSNMLKERIEDEHLLVDSLALCASWQFEYIDIISGELVDAYQREREQWVRSAAAIRAHIVREIIAGASVDPAQTSSRLKYELGRHHIGLLIAGDPDRPAADDSGRLEREAAAAAELLGCSDPLVIPAGATHLWSWMGSHASPPEELVAALEAYRPCTGVRIAIGRPAYGVDGFRLTHLEAQDASRFWGSSSGSSGETRAYRAVEIMSLMSSDLTRARRFVCSRLGGLAEDTDSAQRLRATLLSYLTNNASHVRAAKTMHVHPNTVYMRVRRAEELLGDPVRSRHVEVQTALMLAESLGPDVLAPAR